METFVICAVAFGASILTFFSGFGLGTLLTPVFMLFFPVEVSITLTGVVHFFNNLFKLILVGKNADKRVLIRFGIPAVIASFSGSLLLLQLTDLPAIFTYTFSGNSYSIYPIKLIIALLLIVFSLMDLVPAASKIRFGPEKLPIGGLLSGFFGGLSGHQGALRSAFLIKAGLTKEAFIGTGVFVSAFIDFTRIGVYSTRMHSLSAGKDSLFNSNLLILLLLAIASAVAGAIIGNRLLKKVTIKFLQTFVAAGLFIIALALGVGWL